MASLIFAWMVHFYTALGAVVGLYAVLAIDASNFRLAFFLMAVTIIIDATDGALARAARVREVIPWFDGSLLDNLVDYLNYVIVASLLLVRVDGLMPNGFALPAAISILLTSAYQFSQIDAKTDNQSYFFKGFPSVWNFLVVYMMLLRLNPWINLSLLVICNVLIFVPVKYLYPTRNTRFRKLTLVLTYLYGGLGVWGLVQYPDVPEWVVPTSFVYVIFYAVMSFFPKFGSTKSA